MKKFSDKFIPLVFTKGIFADLIKINHKIAIVTFNDNPYLLIPIFKQYVKNIKI